MASDSRFPASGSSDLHSPRLGLWLLLLGYLFACAPATYPGYWQSHEGFVPVFNAPLSSTIASLATTPDLWRGSGRSAFLLAQPFLALGATPVLAVRVTFALALLLGGLGVYAWLHPRFGDRTAGLAALVYLLMPPVLATVYVRGSVADAMIVALLPLAFAGVTSYAEGRSPMAAAVVVLSVLWMWRCQAGLALFSTLLLIAYAVAVERSRMAVLVAGVSGAAGLASLLPLWGIRGPSPVPFDAHFVSITQLLSSGWQGNTAASPTVWLNEPYRLGYAAVAFGMVGVWLWARRTRIEQGGFAQRLLRFSWAGIVLCVLGLLPFTSAVWALSGAERLLTYPWQLLLVFAPLFAAAAGSLPVLNQHLRRTPLWLALVMLVMLSSFPYLHADYTQVEPPRAPVATFGMNPDLVLLAAQVREEPSGEQAAASGTDEPPGESPVTARLNVTWQVLQPIAVDYNVFFQAVTQSGDEWQVLAQLDTQPRQGLDPATDWMVGQIMTDTYTLELPTPLPEGNVRYFYGYYDWRDGTRLPVDGGIDDKLILYGE